MPSFRSFLLILCLAVPPAALAQLAPSAPASSTVSSSPVVTPLDATVAATSSSLEAGASLSPEPQPEQLLPDAPLPQRPLTAAVPSAAQQEPSYPLVNGQPYRPPTEGDLVHYYFHTIFGTTGQTSVLVRTLFNEAVDSPSGWDQNWTGFGQRLGSNEGILVINQTVKLGLSNAFHEDFRYFRCRGCSFKDKISNVLLAEVTARHGADGHRLVSITPIASHIAGTLVAHAAWYPPGNDGVKRSSGGVATALITQVGIHLFEEFFLRHAAEKLPPKVASHLPGYKAPKPITD